MKHKPFYFVPLLIAAVFLSGSAVWAAHPLVTEDTGTQGRGKYQLEVQFERGRDVEGDTTEKSSSLATVLAYGFHERADLMLTLPYERVRTTVDGDTSAERGHGDVAADVKWRFYEEGKLGVALKSGITLPTGDENRGLGTGKSNASALLIASIDLEPVELHVTGGYIGNRNVADEKTRIRHLSVGGLFSVGDFKLVADIGRYTTVDRSLDKSSVFGILGTIWSPNDDVDLDVGVKWGLSDPETDRALLAGVTLRF